MAVLPWLHTRRRLRRGDRSRQFQIEGLESRLVLYSTTGGAWVYNTITYSFVPDGTYIAASNNGNIYSNLNQALNSEGISTAQWQQAMDKAAATWEAVAGINLVRVSDDGAAIGSSQYQQGNPAEGDIRIGGYVQSPGTLAQTFLPPPINGGSEAGDIFFNTGTSWHINSDYDLLSVALHEFGHALGMGHSQITQAVMYAMYTGVKQQLNSDDVAGIDSIYGPRQPDQFNSYGNSNATYQQAFNLSPYFVGQDQIAVPNLSINTGGQMEWFQVTVPSGTSGKLTITEQTSGLSSMSPELVIETTSLGVVGQARALYSYGATVSVTVNNVVPGQTFLIRASAASMGPDGYGEFGLLVNAGSGSMSPIPTPNTVVYAQPNQGGGSLNQITGGGGSTSSSGAADPPEMLPVGLPGNFAAGDSLTVAPGFIPSGGIGGGLGNLIGSAPGYGVPFITPGGPSVFPPALGFLVGSSSNQNALNLWDDAIDSLSS